MEQPSYLTDLALCDFSLFPKLKKVIKETRFEDLEALRDPIKIFPGEHRRD